MKKCLIMFGLLITILLLAVITDKEEDQASKLKVAAAQDGKQHLISDVIAP